MYDINKQITRLDPLFMNRAAAISPATLHEAYGRRGAVNRIIRPIQSGVKICGSALTVACSPGDNLGLHVAIALAESGDVLVARTEGDADFGYWGEIMSVAALQKKIAGLVIWGCVRDYCQLCKLQVPVFATGLSVKGTTKEAFCSINRPIFLGDVKVTPGDLVVGDDDGVVTVCHSEVQEVIENAIRREAKEESIKEKLKKGASTLDLFELTGVLEKRHISI